MTVGGWAGILLHQTFWTESTLPEPHFNQCAPPIDIFLFSEYLSALKVCLASAAWIRFKVRGRHRVSGNATRCCWWPCVRGSHINRKKALNGGRLPDECFTVTGRPSQSQNHKQGETHLLWNALQSSSTLDEQHYIMCSGATHGRTSLLIEPRLETKTRRKPGQTNQSGRINVSEPVTHLLSGLEEQNAFPFSFLFFFFAFCATLAGRHNTISGGWTVRKEEGSDSLLGCKK